MKNAKYIYTKTDHSFYCKLKGECNYANCGSFEKLIQSMAKDDKITNYIFDLTETEWIDSTVLGHIASLVRLLKFRKKSIKPVILSTKPDIIHLLRSLAFDKYFEIIEKPMQITGKFQELEHSQQKEEEMAQTILAAHKNLIELDPRNREKFQEVIELFEQSLQNHKK
jgi:anti-anti-sigma factor